MFKRAQNGSLTAWVISLFLLLPIVSCSNSDIETAASNHPLPECPNSPNCIRTQFMVQLESTQAFDLVQNTITQMKADSLTIPTDSIQINSVFRIPLFGWLDDFDVVVSPKEEQTIIFIRSASRVGYSDLGVNKRRVRKFIRILTQKLPA